MYCVYVCAVFLTQLKFGLLLMYLLLLILLLYSNSGIEYLDIQHIFTHKFNEIVLFLVSNCHVSDVLENGIDDLFKCLQWPEFNVNLPALGNFNVNASFFKKFDYSSAMVWV